MYPFCEVTLERYKEIVGERAPQGTKCIDCGETGGVYVYLHKEDKPRCRECEWKANHLITPSDTEGGAE